MQTTNVPMQRALPECADDRFPDQVLSRISDAVASTDAEHIFDVLVRGAAEVLGVDLALIGVLTGCEPPSVETIAACGGGQMLPSFTYILAGTPCADVVGKHFRYFADNVQEVYTDDPYLRELGAIGYAAIPLFDFRGNAMGLMAVAGSRPLCGESLCESVLRILSVRAAIELERRTADAARRRSEESYRSVFEAAGDALSIHDADSGALLDVNPAACALYGASREALLGLVAAGPSTAESSSALAQIGALIEQARHQGPIHSEWRREVADGTPRWHETDIEPAAIGGERRLLAVTRDITERREAEAERVRLEGQLRQAQKMEAIGQLTGGIAHDFNNILTATMGYLVMAQERAGRYDDARLEKYLRRAEDSGQRAKALIQEMLTFSRGERGESRSVQVGPRIAEVVNLLHSTLPSSLEIHTDLAADVPSVELDPLHLEQVLVNLCINARDAMDGKGRLSITLGTAECGGCTCSSCHQPVSGAYVELAVVDTGPGIDPGVLERMFEPFYSTKEVGKGSGMGLAMVHGIVHEYAGHVHVDSAPGRGTTMRIWLPVQATRAEEVAHSLPLDMPARGDLHPLRGRILLAEDDATVRQFMEDLLESWGLEVVAAEDGVDACNRFLDDPETIDLAVMDYTMPKMTGLEAAERVHQVRNDLPVVLYTGHSEGLTDAKIDAAGIRSVVRKPLDVPAFRALLDELLVGGSG